MIEILLKLCNRVIVLNKRCNNYTIKQINNYTFIMFKKSQKLYTKGLKNLVGAVKSPVRAFSSAGGNPLFIKKAKGSKITDVDGNE